MKIVTIADVPKEEHATPLFTGPDVTKQSFALDSKDFRLGIINFGKGVRNKWHAHSVDQILIITGGRGYVATETETREVKTGDVICVHAGEKHWHGAADDSEFSHIAITPAGRKTLPME